MRSVLASLCAVLLATACASYDPVPPGYAGSTAIIWDAWQNTTGAKAEFFAVTEIDDHLVPNSLSATRQASAGRGFEIVPVTHMRHVPVRPMKLKLIATHATGAPIHAFVSQMTGDFLIVEGSVDFTPEPDGVYVVNGKLEAARSSVWVEDKRSGQRVTKTVSFPK